MRRIDGNEKYGKKNYCFWYVCRIKKKMDRDFWCVVKVHGTLLAALGRCKLLAEN